MKITGGNHLCYSMNIFPEKDWFSENSQIRKKIIRLKKEILGGCFAKFAVGMWFDDKTARGIRKKRKLEDFKKWLDDNGLYVFTFNAFPYGNFHGKSVKKKVYLPDWTTKKRLEYTCLIADILSELLPADMTGSISTLPGSYKSDVKSERQIAEIAENLLSAGNHLKKIYETTGKKIIIGVEPEPDCLWENIGEFIEFYKKYIISADKNVGGYLGVCYDTCHQEVTCGRPGEGIKRLIKSRIPIAKIQLSASLEASGFGSKAEIANFADKIYLHQTRVINNDGSISAYDDLPAALERSDANSVWAVHYHIPVFATKLRRGLFASKRELLEILKMIKSKPCLCTNLEIETYTFSVLPENMRKSGALKVIKKEYEWIGKILNYEIVNLM